MKKHIKIPCFLCLPLVPISSLVLFGCEDKNNDPLNPIIIGPEESTINLVHFSHVDSTLLKGFSYGGITNPSNIVIENTFSQSLAVFKTRVSNINFANKTFDIELIAYDAQPQELTGVLSFYYEGQLIENAPTTQVNLNITPTPIVGDQFDRVQTIQLDHNGFGECSFENFSIDNAPNLQELLDYDVHFTQAGTRIETELVFIDDSHFNLKVKVSSAVQDTIKSDVSFRYNNHILSIPGSNTLTINILAAKKITAPTQTDYVLETSQKDGQIIIPDFNFLSIEEENLGVNVTTQDNVALSASIVNWQEDKNTFAVQVDATFEHFCDFTFTLSFYDKSTLEPFEYEGHDFQITTNSIVPREMLDIVEEEIEILSVTHKWLNGFKPESISELQTLGYNTLLVPNDITNIGDDAFRETPVTSLKNLIFPSNSSLYTIGSHAFFRDACFNCDLTIPYSVNCIETYAFGGCEGLKSLTFENKTHTISLEDMCFWMCNHIGGDLILPTYASLGDFQVFASSTFDGTLYFPAHIEVATTGFHDSFRYMTKLVNIDVTAYTDIPSWMSDSASADFSDMGVFATGEKHVFYNKNLIPSRLEEMKAFFSKSNLPDDFIFVPK